MQECRIIILASLNAAFADVVLLSRLGGQFHGCMEMVQPSKLGLCTGASIVRTVFESPLFLWFCQLSLERIYRLCLECI